MINIFEIMEGEKVENNSCAIDESVLIPKGNILKLRVIARNNKNEIEPGICQTKTGLKYAFFGFKVNLKIECFLIISICRPKCKRFL